MVHRVPEGSADQLRRLPPGFRFHPTDEELVVDYLYHKACSKVFQVPVIAEVDLYQFDPWNLPELALFGDKEWYYFSPRGRKYPNGDRPNRTAGNGYWKATGKDRLIHMSGGHNKVGKKKALVFYQGRPPKGKKTDWIMHEYRLADRVPRPDPLNAEGPRSYLDDWVLCRIYNKKSKRSQQDAGENDDPPTDEVLSSLPAIDDILPHSLSPIPESSLQQLPETTSQSGYLMDSLHKRMMSNTGGVSMQENSQAARALPNDWRSMYTACANPNSRYASQDMMLLAPRSQTLNPGLTMAMNQSLQQTAFHQSYIAAQNPGLGAGSAFNDEVQSISGFSSNDGSLASIFPSVSCEHRSAQSTLAYAHEAMPTSSWSSYDCSYDCLDPF